MVSVIWLYGLSGSGKSTLSAALYNCLKDQVPIKRLDGDDLRTGLNSNLGFSDAD
ncbi:MAG: adenylyl-sulfate kinase, partial [Breznakibacter sp.]|nr:adenylyl-sulfate kinase [Breznakibacter sp.]